MVGRKNKDGKKHFQIEPPTTEDFERLVKDLKELAAETGWEFVGTGTLDVVYMEEIRPFEEKFKEICDFFYRGGWITKKEYDELLSLLNQSKDKVKDQK